MFPPGNLEENGTASCANVIWLLKNPNSSIKTTMIFLLNEKNFKIFPKKF
jgi:hypothetical protein